MRENLKLLLFIWWYSLILSQRHWHVITDWQTEPYETKELLTTIKMYITIINILIFVISIGIVIIVIIILTITITFTTINIIIVFVKSACRLSMTISYNSCVTWLLTSNFRTCFFIYLFSLFKSYDSLWIWTIFGQFDKYWSALKTDRFKREVSIELKQWANIFK